MIKMKSVFNICNIYLAIWCLYYMQGILYDFGSTLSRTFAVLGLILSMYYWVYANFTYNLPKLLKIINWLLVMFSLYGFLLVISGDKIFKHNTGQLLTGFEYVRNVYSSLMTIFPCYVFAKKGYLNDSSIRIWFFVFLITITGQFVNYENVRTERAQYDTDGLTNNIAYDFVAILPMLFLFRKKPIVQYLSLAFILSFVIYGMKRGAIIIAVVFLLLFMYDHLKTLNFKNIIFRGTLFIVVFGFLYDFVDNLAASKDYFQFRLNKTLEGDSSGRDLYYSFLWNNFLEQQEYFRIMFGRGAYSTVKIIGNHAHNDWLEILVNNGLVGIFFYFNYWFCFVKKAIKNRHNSYIYVFYSVGIIYFIKSFFSMSYSSYTVAAMVAMAYCLSCFDNKTI